MEGKLITVAKFANYIEAELSKQTLAGFGIQAVVVGGNTANVYSGLAFAKAELQVPQTQAEEALNILQSTKS
ncbi:MAG: putative signal transducing protein [Planctomycetota bacterium]|jgi:hypothetical protein